MVISLSIDDVLGFFDAKIVNARWLETHGNNVDQEIARNVRCSLESVRRDLLEKLDFEEVRHEDPRQSSMRLVA